MGTVRYQVIEKDGQEFVEEIHKVIVHTFNMGDVEDPDLWAGQSLYEWQISEPGKFIMEHSLDKPVWNRQLDYATYGHKYIITAELESKKLSEFYLRWGKNGSNSIR
jgi:hypothetical protein